MEQVLAEGVSRQSMDAALAEFRHRIGADAVFVTGDERFSFYVDAYPIDDPQRFAPAAGVAPHSVEQVQSVLEIANRHRIPMWTISTGRNNAYGGAAPRLKGSVIVDLSRMNRILEVNEASAYCVVEPGVTFLALYQHLRDRNIKLWISPPELGWGSLVGNALDHGVGYTPMGDNFGFSCGMEVVLPEGDVVRTGMGAMAKSNSWHLFKYGFGPVMDGLFTQSNFGIVTKLGMWLMPEPPGYRSYMISFPREDDLHQIIEIMRPLRIANIIQNCGMVTPWTYEVNLARTRAECWAGEGPIPEREQQRIIDEFDIGYWNIYASQYGTPVIMDEYWGIIRAAFAQIPGARFCFAHERPELKGLQLRDLLGKGVPNMGTLDAMNWVPNAGHVDFSPVSPSTGADATTLYRMMKKEAQRAGFDYIGAFIIGWREMHNVLLMIYDKDNPAERDRIRNLFPRLVETAAAAGYGEYRTHIAFMDEVAASFDFNDNAMLRLSERIKDALDPNGILAAGKSGIWPRHLRERS